MYYDNILATIGHTPLIKLSRICSNFDATVLGKVEAFNPGNSAKDRTALYMIEQAEKRGEIKPNAGYTIIEATSGNTGYSMAMICSLKGYKCVLTVSSKASREKIALLRSMGAQVVICPKDAAPEDPRSYYSRAVQLSKEIPKSYYLAQNFNPDNIGAHYATTGPEIWEQTEGKITHYVACAGTGGTLSGTARFLKEKNPAIQIIAVDAYGSVLKKYWETGEFDESEIFSYKIEGLGKTIIPDNVDFNVIDDFIKVTDKKSAIRARLLAKHEGLLCGYSSGAAMETVFKIKERLKPTDVVVVLFPDHGSRYVGKIYNDEWMRQQGFLGKTPVDSNYEYIRRIYKTYKIKTRRYIRQTLSKIPS